MAIAPPPNPSFPGPGVGLPLTQDSTQCTSLLPWWSPGIGVLVVTAVVEELHHGLLGERGWRMGVGCQAAWRGPQPPPYRAQGPHLGGAGQELLLLLGRCHRGDEAQRGQVLPFLLEKKRKVVNSTSKDHSLPHLKVFKSCLLPLGKNPDLVVHKALQNSTSLISSLPLSPACWASTLLMACCLAHPVYTHLALCCSHCWEQSALSCLHGWLFYPLQISNIVLLRGCWFSSHSSLAKAASSTS